VVSVDDHEDSTDMIGHVISGGCPVSRGRKTHSTSSTLVPSMPIRSLTGLTPRAELDETVPHLHLPSRGM